MRAIIKDSTLWGRVRTAVIFAFTSKYSLALYELITARINLTHVWQEDFSLQDLRELLGVPDDKLRRMPDLLRYCVKVAELEVTGLADFGVKIEPIRTLGKDDAWLDDGLQGYPIFVAIERHKAACIAREATSFALDDLMNNPEARAVSDAEWDAYDRARAAEDAAFDELLTRAPTTASGMRAALAHFISFDDGRFSEKMKRFLATLVKSPVFAA